MIINVIIIIVSEKERSISVDVLKDSKQNYLLTSTGSKMFYFACFLPEHSHRLKHAL